MARAPSSSRRQSGAFGIFAVAVLLVVCSSFSIGLTFATCYSSLCVEKWFPTQARIHIAVFYGGIGIAAAGLAAWSHSKAIRSVSSRHILDAPIPVLGIRLSVGGVSLSLWILAITLLTTAYWPPAEHAFWYAKGIQADWTQYMFRVTWAGVTGHWCDIVFGLVFLPVGRDSMLSKVFGVQASALLLAHKFLACALCLFGLIHGLLYYSFLAAYVANASRDNVHNAFNPDNPYYTWKQIEDNIGPYGWFVLPTGAFVGIILIPVMVITALPVIRRNSYNTFYYIHIIFALIALVLSCLHASTNFYFILPGLLLWVYDWSHRLQHGLCHKQTIEVESASNDWYRMRLPQTPRPAISDTAIAEKGLSPPLHGSTPSHPLETYYIRLSAVSKVQIHPFTAAATATSSSGPSLLFQKSPSRKQDAKSRKEWTWQLGAIIDQNAEDNLMQLEARIEGPYITSVPELYAANCVLAIVGGTGITGALSLADWWLSRQDTVSPHKKHLRIVWSIRHAKTADIAEIHALQRRLQSVEQTLANLEIHDSSLSGRLRPNLVLDNFMEAQRNTEGGRTFVYISGPAGLAAGAEAACIEQQKRLRAKHGRGANDEISWHNATYTL